MTLITMAGDLTQSFCLSIYSILEKTKGIINNKKTAICYSNVQNHTTLQMIGFL